MRSTVRLLYGFCPTCGTDALIETETTELTAGAQELRRTRITRVECSNVDCLHHPTVLQAR